ncbi:MAG: FtsQ-type POTRA domain-containing protein [Anaerolineales bacterium]
MSSGEGTLRRADLVRARRLQRREGGPILGRGGEERNVEVPRMVTRNPEVERRLAAEYGVQPRRRRYLKLADAGAELRLPVLPSVHVGWQAISGLTAAVCLVALYFMATSGAFTISSVELLGAQRLDVSALNTALQITGSSVFNTEPGQLLSILRDQFPELEKVSVSVGFPSKVVVRVVERQPVLSWDQAGLTVWVDAAGVAFTPQNTGEGLVHVTALEAPPTLEEDQYGRHQLIRAEMVSAIQTLAQIAPEGASLIYDPTLGFGWADPGGWQAFFGHDGSDIVQRMAVYRSILNELATRRLTPTLISVAQLHAPYYRMDY